MRRKLIWPPPPRRPRPLRRRLKLPRIPQIRTRRISPTLSSSMTAKLRTSRARSTVLSRPGSTTACPRHPTRLRRTGRTTRSRRITSATCITTIRRATAIVGKFKMELIRGQGLPTSTLRRRWPTRLRLKTRLITSVAYSSPLRIRRMIRATYGFRVAAAILCAARRPKPRLRVTPRRIGSWRLSIRMTQG